MARTRASVGAKVSSGKSSKARCCVAPPPSTSGASGSAERAPRNHGSGGGNPVCHRETPKWQKPITSFFINKDERQNTSREDDAVDVEEAAGSSKPKQKPNIIYSDDEEETEKPKNKVLDESIHLEPLNGEDSHKLEEYYPKGHKGKGLGKKTKGKENKRSRVEDNVESASKRVKVAREDVEMETASSLSSVKVN